MLFAKIFTFSYTELKAIGSCRTGQELEICGQQGANSIRYRKCEDRQLRSDMDARDRSVIDRHLPRLEQCLEPAKLLRYLEHVRIFDEDDVELVRQENIKTSRENQVATFVDILKRREHGFRYLLKALLTSKVQDFLARELLQDDVYNEEEISSIMEELKNDLDETQTLKLRLIEEQKRHRSIARELENVKRNSLVYSDSGSSGLFADYDSMPSDDSEFIRYSPRGLEQRLEREDDKSTPVTQSYVAKNEEFEWEHEDGWRGFGSVDHIDALSNNTNKKRCLDNFRRSSSLGRLNHIVVERPASNQRVQLGKWNVESFSINRKGSSKQNSEPLEEKLALLEKQLQDEKRRREISENEVATLQLQKEELFEELEDTREQLRTSHLNLYYEDDFEEELCFEDEVMCEQRGATEKKIRFSPVDCRETAGQSRSLDSNQLRSQTERMRKSRMTGSWRKVNAQFYELDEYENEINVEMDPRNILDNLRRLKTYTSSLYNDVLSERDELKTLKKRVEKLGSN